MKPVWNVINPASLHLKIQSSQAAIDQHLPALCNLWGLPRNGYGVLYIGLEAKPCAYSTSYPHYSPWELLPQDACFTETTAIPSTEKKNDIFLIWKFWLFHIYLLSSEVWFAHLKHQKISDLPNIICDTFLFSKLTKSSFKASEGVCFYLTV